MTFVLPGLLGVDSIKLVPRHLFDQFVYCHATSTYLQMLQKLLHEHSSDTGIKWMEQAQIMWNNYLNPLPWDSIARLQGNDRCKDSSFTWRMTVWPAISSSQERETTGSLLGSKQEIPSMSFRDTDNGLAQQRFLDKRRVLQNTKPLWN